MNPKAMAEARGDPVSRPLVLRMLRQNANSGWGGSPGGMNLGRIAFESHVGQNPHDDGAVQDD